MLILILYIVFIISLVGVGYIIHKERPDIL